MAKTTKYLPNQTAKSQPRVLIFEGSQIAIGKEVKKEFTAPKPSTIVPEATPEQYEKLYLAGYTHLIEKVEE